jgi:hypothetical protein
MDIVAIGFINDFVYWHKIEWLTSLFDKYFGC